MALPAKIKGRRSCDRGFFEPKSLKNRMFVGTSISEAFWKVFGTVWGNKNLRFSHFFDVFSKSFLKRASEGPKIEQNAEKRVEGEILELDSGGPQAPGERL